MGLAIIYWVLSMVLMGIAAVVQRSGNMVIANYFGFPGLALFLAAGIALTADALKKDAQ